MTLKLISSNRVERLQQSLSDCLAAEPLRDPFQSELIIVPGMAMSRWINLRLAQSLGVAANIEYRLPADWIWQLASSVLPAVPEQDPLTRESAAWRLYEILPPLLSAPAFASLRDYLATDQDGVRRWQLAQRIADVFDRYQFYRPDWIRAWGAGDDSSADHPWQPLLWRELIRDLGGCHRVSLIDQLMQALSRLDSAGVTLPARVSLFALSSLPPLFVSVIQALAEHVDVYLYQHSPTDQYWADLKSKKQQARLRLQSPDVAQYHDNGNDLLVSWGRQGQAFQDLLLSHEGLEAAHQEDYSPPGDDNLLHRLQQAIFTLDDDARVTEPDESIQISICHSPLRECQVLHDQLLRELEQDPSLKPEDILVMVPDISRYAPYIEAVFRRDETDSRPFIPWNLSDITLADEHPLIRVFFRLLQLPASRFSFSDIISLLEIPEIAGRFRLTQRDCDDLHQLLQQAGLRWGLDGEHKRELGLPPMETNTWRQGIDRLLAGYAMGESLAEPLWQGLAPLGVGSSGAAVLLGRFSRLLDRLVYWRGQLQRVRSGEEWQLSINCLLDDFFQVTGEDDDRLQQIRDVLASLQQDAGQQSISPALLGLWLENALGSQRQRGRFFSGGVTFCGMRPMRSLPFRIICLPGMNDQDFPRRDVNIEFDSMAGQWRPGDPRKGDEDRYLLLETLLCARQKLYFSYVGRSLKDNEPRQPSVLLRELSDFLDTRYLLKGEAGSEPPLMSKAISHEYSMQPFSARNYAEHASPRAYDQYWCQVAHELASVGEEPTADAWPEQELPLLTERDADESERIELSRLRRFLLHPVQYFVQQRLRVRLQEDDVLDDEEVFELGGLDAWRIHDRLLHDWLRGVDTPVEVLTAQGLLPHGSLAGLAADKVDRQLDVFREQLAAFRQVESVTQSISLAMPAGRLLEGTVENYLPGRGLLHVAPAKFKGKYLLALWLEHLALCASGILEKDEFSYLYCRDEALRMPLLGKQTALEELRLYVAMYAEGMLRPLPVFPRSSFAAAAKLAEGKEEGDALKAASGAWYSSPYSSVSGDEEDAAIALIMRGVDAVPIHTEEFLHRAQQLYARALLEKEPV